MVSRLKEKPPPLPSRAVLCHVTLCFNLCDVLLSKTLTKPKIKYTPKQKQTLSLMHFATTDPGGHKTNKTTRQTPSATPPQTPQGGFPIRLTSGARGAVRSSVGWGTHRLVSRRIWGSCAAGKGAYRARGQGWGFLKVREGEYLRVPPIKIKLSDLGIWRSEPLCQCGFFASQLIIILISNKGRKTIWTASNIVLRAQKMKTR